MTGFSSVDEAFDVARARNPQICFARHLYREHVATRTRDDVSRLHLIDLFVACGALHGVRGALEDIEARLPDLHHELARIDSGRDFGLEALQRVRVRLLVSADQRPAGIRGYSGSGSLQGWLRTVAIGVGLSLRRERAAERSSAEPEQDLARLATAVDASGRYARLRSRAEFKAAFQEALALLSPDERNTLKLLYVDELGIEAVATFRRVHRTTIVRELVRVKHALRATTERVLARRYGLDPDERESLLRSLGSSYGSVLSSGS